jgi:hypothetical protein
MQNILILFCFVFFFAILDIISYKCIFFVFLTSFFKIF